MSDDEFWRLTPLRFKELIYRKTVEFRHRCMMAGIIAADARNIHRTQSSDRVWEAMDYVICEDEPDPHREEAKRNIASLYRMREQFQPMTPEQAAEQKEKVIRDLRKQGFEDAEDIFAEIFAEGG